MQKITPFLWFDDQAEQAVAFYTSVFKNSPSKVSRGGGEDAASAGRVTSASFELGGVEFIAFNGGPHFKFSEAISLYVNCESQGEVDYFWEALSEGGQTQRCGWLKDKFGVSWQIVPSALPRLLQGPDRDKAGKVMQAMMQMKKIDIAGLEQA